MSDSPANSGAARCPACGVVYARVHWHTCTPPEQTTLFEVPPAPVPVGWSLQWCWKPEYIELMAGIVALEGYWQPHTTQQHNGSRREVINAAARLRRRFPGKKFRCRATKFRDPRAGFTPLLSSKQIF